MEQQILDYGPWPPLNYPATFVDRAQKETSIVDFYENRYPLPMGVGEWERRIISGLVSVNGRVETCPTVRVKANAKLEYHRPPFAEPDAPTSCGIIYEDDHVLALNKPAGLQVLVAGAFTQRCVLTILQKHYGTASTPAPVHRLGRGTSGVLLCAKTPESKRSIPKQLEEKTRLVVKSAATLRNPTESVVAATAGLASSSSAAAAAAIAAPAAPELLESSQLASSSSSISPPNPADDEAVQKLYLALVQGHIASDSGMINAPIGPVEYQGVRGGLFAVSPEGKAALSRYWVVRRDAPLVPGGQWQTLVLVKIFSGRPHQIRIHMASIGHPLVGDPLYIAGGQPRPPETLTRDLPDGSGSGASDAVSDPPPLIVGHLPPRNDSLALPGDCGYFLHCYRMRVAHPDPARGLVWFVAEPPKEYGEVAMGEMEVLVEAALQATA